VLPGFVLLCLAAQRSRRRHGEELL